MRPRHAVTSRRSLLMRGAAGALLLAVGVPPAVAGAGADTVPIGAFLRVGADGDVTVIAPCVEMGQGSHTALAMIVADELGADWSRVSVQAPPLGAPYRTPGRPMQNTSGSQMIRRWNAPLRKSAAAAREMLTQAAAAQWNVDPASCRVADGAVIHETSRRRAGFGELAAAASKLPEPASPALRTGLSIVGQSPHRLDLGAKVDGSAVFGIDVRVPGMVYAAIRQAPVYGSQLLAVESNGVEGQAGVIRIVRLADAVAVVATTYWQAKQATEDLEPQFSQPQQARLSSDDIVKSQQIQLDSPVATTAISTGTVPPMRPGTRGVLSADYSVPFLHHATMEPMTCTVSITSERCEFWVPTQNLTGVADVGVKVSGLSLDKVVVNATLLGGGFGRKFEQDFVEQAALIAKEIRRPVQLIWSREEDMQHGFYRPAMTARLSSVMNGDGDVEALRMRIVGPSVLEHTAGYPMVRGVDPVALLGISTETPRSPSKIQQYSIANFLAEYIYQPTHVPVGYWRSVGASENGFFIESHVDELAAKAGADPYQFRRRLLRDSPRALAVLDRAAREAGWGGTLPDGHHQGIAFSECVGSLVSEVIEVSVTDAGLKVHKVVCVIDCGTAIHPGNVRAQTAGGIVMGLSAALGEQITIKDGRCEQSNFHDYPVARLADTPEIQVHIIESGEALGGVGEASVPAVAPALCNAIFAATGKRIRSLPVRA